MVLETISTVFITGGSNASVTFVSVGTLLSYGTVTDGTQTVDYAVRFESGSNPLRAESINNAFVVHSDGSADFYSSSHRARGSIVAGTFADNGDVSISMSFYDHGTFDSGTGTGTATDAMFSLSASNHGPETLGGATVQQLSSSEFYDLDWGGVGTYLISDPLNQIVTDQTPGITTLVNYEPNRLPIGSTGTTDPGTGGITDPLTGDLRLEFNVTHDIADAAWEFTLPEASVFTITRTGDDGQRSAIGLSGLSLTSVPEPGGVAHVLLVLIFLTPYRRRRSAG